MQHIEVSYSKTYNVIFQYCFSGSSWTGANLIVNGWFELP